MSYDLIRESGSAIFSEGCFAKNQKAGNFRAAINGLSGADMKNNPASSNEKAKRKDAKMQRERAFKCKSRPMKLRQSPLASADGIPAELHRGAGSL